MEDETLNYERFNSSGIRCHVGEREKFSVSIFRVYDLDRTDPDDLGIRLLRKVSG